MTTRQTTTRTMQALTVRQPWAGAIFTPPHPKDIENRTWTTTHRGPLLIHAARNVEPPNVWSDVRRALGGDIALATTSAIIGVVELVDVITGSTSPWAMSRFRFHWVLARPRLFSHPVPYRGEPGLFSVPIADLAALLPPVVND